MLKLTVSNGIAHAQGVRYLFAPLDPLFEQLNVRANIVDLRRRTFLRLRNCTVAALKVPRNALHTMDKDTNHNARGIAVVVMGVTGCGKSTIGKMLSERMKFTFIDGDDFHPAENKEKMADGIPLTDDDRIPWLKTLRRQLETSTSGGRSVVLACSALRSVYRDILQGVSSTLDGDGDDKDSGNQSKGAALPVVFMHIRGTLELFESRLSARYKEGKHFMHPGLLPSQMALLDTRVDEKRVIPIDANFSPEECVSSIQEQLHMIFGHKFSFI